MTSLRGITVLDLSSVGPGSRCTAILADLGARVIKVWPPSSSKRIEPQYWAYGAGRGTRRLRIDLRAPAGRDAFLRLCEAAHVVVESYRPGVAAKLGIGYEDARKHNDRIVYCSVTGYGADGPNAQRAGHDLNYLAVGGFLATQGRATDGAPAIPGATVADSAAGGMQATIAILAALLRGHGEHLDISTTEGVLSLVSLYMDEYLATGFEASAGNALLTGGYAFYGVYSSSDGGWLAVAAIEPAFFANLCNALGVAEWIPHQMDPARQDKIRAAFQLVFATKTRDEWTALLADADCCVTPVLSIAEATRDEHLAARNAFGTAAHPSRGAFRQVARAFGAARSEGAEAAGVDATREVLGSAGFSDEEIDQLHASGVIE